MSDAGVAFVQIVPSMRGASRAITQELGRNLTRPLRQAGEQGGADLTAGVTDGMSRSKGAMSSAVGRLGDILKTGLAAAGLAAGALLVVGLSTAFEQEAATDKLVAQLGGSEWAEEMGRVAGNLYTEAFGDSVADTGAAVRAVVQSPLVAEDAGADEIEEVTRLALTFSDVMEQDVRESVRAVGVMMRTGMARDAEHGFDLLTRAQQQGLDVSGDLLETTIEYGTQFRELGLEGEEAFGLISQALRGGARDTDFAADALKEFAIRAQDGSKLSAEGFALIGLSAEEMTAKVAAGGPAAREALGQTLDALREIEDPALRNAAAVALFGTKAEDLGDALFAMDLDTAAMELGQVEGATDQLSSAYDNAATRVEEFKRKALQRLVDFLGNTVIPALEEFAAWAGPILSDAWEQTEEVLDRIDWEGLAEAWTVFVNAVQGDIDPDLEGPLLLIQQFGEGVGNVVDEFIRPAFEWIVENETAATAALAALAVGVGVLLAGAFFSLGAAVLSATWPLLLIVGAAAAVALGIIWLYENVEEFREVVDTALPLIQEIFFGTLTFISALIEETVAVMQDVWGEWGDEIVEVADIAWSTISGLILGSLTIISGLVKLFTGLITGDWDLAWEGMKQIVSGAWQQMWSVTTGALRLIWLGIRVAFTVIRMVVKAILGDTIDWAKDKWGDFVDFVKGLPGKFRRGLAGIRDAISAPFRAAFNAIRSAWNSTAGGFGINIPGMFGFGGVNFTIPRMHSGGIVPGIGDQLILAKGGEGIFTEGQMAAIGAGAATQPAQPTRVVLTADGESMFIRWIKNMVRVEGGGDVNVAFGGTG